MSSFPPSPSLKGTPLYNGGEGVCLPGSLWEEDVNILSIQKVLNICSAI